MDLLGIEPRLTGAPIQAATMPGSTGPYLVEPAGFEPASPSGKRAFSPHPIATKE